MVADVRSNDQRKTERTRTLIRVIQQDSSDIRGIWGRTRIGNVPLIIGLSESRTFWREDVTYHITISFLPGVPFNLLVHQVVELLGEMMGGL